MARLGVTSLAGNCTAQQIRDAVTRQNPELASIASSSAVTSRKNFSPTFNANGDHRSARSCRSAPSQRTIQRQQIAIGKGLQEGLYLDGDPHATSARRQTGRTPS